MQAVWNWPQQRLTRRSEAAFKFYQHKFAATHLMDF